MYHTGYAVLHIYEQPGSVVRCTVQDMLYCIYMNSPAVWSDVPYRTCCTAYINNLAVWSYVPYRTCCTAYILTAWQCDQMYRTGYAVLHIYEQPGSVVRCTIQDMLYCIYNNLAVWSDVLYRTCCTAYILTARQCDQMYRTGYAVLHIYEQSGSVVRCTVQDMLYCIYMNNPAVWSDVPYRTCCTVYIWTTQQCGQMYRTCCTAYIWTARQCGQMYRTGHAVLHI